MKGSTIIINEDDKQKQKKRKAQTDSESESDENPKNSTIQKQTSKQLETIVLGIIAMEKKSKCKPMKQILNKLECPEIKIIVLDDQVLFEKDIKEWPKVDCLISFYSDGFPLRKVQKYAKLRKPFLINDLKKQEILWDRREIYLKLRQNQIPTTKHVFAIRQNKQKIKDIFIQKEKEVLYQKQQRQEDESENNMKVEMNLMKEASIQNDINSSNKSQNSIQSIQNIVEKNQTKNKFSGDDIEVSLSQIKSLKQENIEKTDDFQISSIEEFDDHIIVDGVKIKKPFVEKPFNAEDHNIYIYYRQSDGGGCKKLFRKINDKSSDFEKNLNNIRTDGNYIYEEFLPTDGFDIKVYTVGPEYTHAEARKAPVLDGKVNRTATGKEVRYPVTLTPSEKFIAKKIVKIFGQNVTGFDLLRSNGKSYVCDVNGWSFVKGNEQYFQDCAYTLKLILFQRFFPEKLQQNGMDYIAKNLFSNMKLKEYQPKEQMKNKYQQEELRSLVAIFRHGDRTPKQKMKMKISHELFIDFFKVNQLKDKWKDELKVKSPKLMAKLLQIVGETIEDLSTQQNDCQFYGEDYESEDNVYQTIVKLIQMMSVLEKDGSFEGIYRKVQFKPLKFIYNEDQSIKDIQEVLVIIKWGGQLTHKGEEQAEELGKYFRVNQYPVDKDGLIRLHNTYRHDLKTYASDEGRCQMTAGNFIKGFLNYEGDVAPIMNSLLTRNEYSFKLLDQNEDQNLKQQINDQLSELLNSEKDLLTHFKEMFKTDFIKENMQIIMKKIGNPREKLSRLYYFLRNFTNCLFEYQETQSKSYYIQPNDFKNYNQVMSKKLMNFQTQQSQRCKQRHASLIKPKADDIGYIFFLCYKNQAIYYNSIHELHQGEQEDKQERSLSKKSSDQNEHSPSKLKKDSQPISQQADTLDVKKSRSESEIDHVEISNEKMEKIKNLKACGNESMILMYKRWRKLKIDFYQNQEFNISKIPDIYDNIKYDLLHNGNIIQEIDPNVQEFFQLADLLASFVIPNENGVNEEERITNAKQIIIPLVDKIKKDLTWWKNKEFLEGEFWKWHQLDHKSDIQYDLSNIYLFNFLQIKSRWRHIRTRLYFTSASHMQALFNVITLGLLNMLIETTEFLKDLDNVKSLQYLSHIIFRLYENLSAEPDDPKRFRLELSFSPGNIINDPKEIDDHKIDISQLMPIHRSLNMNEIEQFLTSMGKPDNDVLNKKLFFKTSRSSSEGKMDKSPTSSSKDKNQKADEKVQCSEDQKGENQIKQ